jgi:hypothetical protein
MWENAKRDAEGDTSKRLIGSNGLHFARHIDERQKKDADIILAE